LLRDDHARVFGRACRLQGYPLVAIVGKPSVLDMTPEEHRQRGNAADALFREMKRSIVASE
jgi:hypothetical protein